MSSQLCLSSPTAGPAGFLGHSVTGHPFNSQATRVAGAMIRSIWPLPQGLTLLTAARTYQHHTNACYPPLVPQEACISTGCTRHLALRHWYHSVIETADAATATSWAAKHSSCWPHRLHKNGLHMVKARPHKGLSCHGVEVCGRAQSSCLPAGYCCCAPVTMHTQPPRAVSINTELSDQTSHKS